MIEISRRKYAELLRSEYLLEKLEEGGVYNWEGYGENFDDEYFEIIDLDTEDIIERIG